MALTPQERQKALKMLQQAQGGSAPSGGGSATLERLRKLVPQGGAQTGQPLTQAPEQKGFRERVGERVQERAKPVSDIFQRTGEEMQKKGVFGDIIAGAKGVVQTLGQGASLVGDVIGEASTSAFRALPDFIEDPLRGAGQKALESKPGQFAVEKLGQASEKAQELEKEFPTVGAIGRIGLGAAELGGIGKGVSSVKNLAGTITPSVKALKDVPKQIGGKVGDVVTRGRVTPALERRAINIKTKKLARQELKTSAPEIQRAVSKGLDLDDANRISLLKDKPLLAKKANELLDASIKKGGIHPQEVAGRAMLSQFKKIEKAKNSIGEQLGVFASKIPDEKLKGTNIDMLNRIKKVHGLDGIEMRLNPRGGFKFDFTNTTMSRNKSAQKAITNAFNDGVTRKAKGKHLLRRELLDELNVKDAKRLKKVETLEDRAIMAIRQGLADSLDNANAQYKALNKRFATLEGSLKSTRRVIGTNLADADDVLKASKLGQILRRTTSNVPAEAQKVLDDLKQALDLLGIEDIDLFELQEILNILDKTFDISKDTGLAGILETAGEKVVGKIPFSIQATAGKALRAGAEKTVGPIGITQATKQQAIEELIRSFVKKKSPLGDFLTK